MGPVDFLRTMFEHTPGPVFLTALPSAREIFTRQTGDIVRFVERNDIVGQDGVYFCPSALAPDATLAPGERSLRSKRTAALSSAVWTDIDAKDILISLEDAAKILRGLRYPPSYIVWSGNGLHAYWLLSEPIDVQAEQEAFEAALRLLADRFGGDTAPAHAAPLMRLPGTHNRKRGEAKPVTVEGDGRRYHLEDLEEWLEEQSAAIERAAHAAPRPADGEVNPFLAAAREHGWKPTLDVDGELTRMGSGNIHHTCVRVSASLLMRGVNAEDVVARLLGEIERVKAAAGERFNARREERKLLAMCQSWMAKHPVERRRKEERATGTDDNRGPAEVHHMKEPKKQRAERDKNAATHVVLGQGVLRALEERGEAVLFTPKAIWHCREGIWSMAPREEGKGILDPLVEEGCAALRLDSDNKIASETRGWISRQPHLNRLNLEFDRHGKVPTRSGLLDPDSLTLEPLIPSSFCTWRVEAAYDPSAACPWWLQMLNDAFADRPEVVREETIQLLQELAGAALIDVKPREMAKGLILQGGSNTGKTGLIDVLSGLFGSDPITATLDSIEGAHGLMPFMRRAPWALHEAFEVSKWHFSASVKAIITGEPFAVNIKNGPMLTIRYRGPLFWATNYPPQFREATRAVVNRFVVIECRRVFDEDDERVGAAAEAVRQGFSKPSELILAHEMAGVLNWALEGLRRARAAGRITLNLEARDAREEIHREGNLVAGFVADCCSFDPDMMMSTADFLAAFSAWWTDQKGENRDTPSTDALGKAMRALGEPRIAVHRTEMRDNSGRYYGGLLLNEKGKEYHKRILDSKAFEGRTIMATRDGAIAKDIPVGWHNRESVARMRLAHARDRSSAFGDHPRFFGDRSSAFGDHPRFFGDRSVLPENDRSPSDEKRSPAGHGGRSPAQPIDEAGEDAFSDL